MTKLQTLPLRSALAAMGCALALVLLQVPAAFADDSTSMKPVAEKGHSLPVTTTFEKVTADGGGGSVLNLKNVSPDALKVTVTIVPSVTFHANAKTKTLPAHVIDAGQVWTIGDLAAGDKLSIVADGFDQLDVTVP